MSDNNNSSSGDLSESGSWKSFGTVLLTDFAILLGIFVAFWALRKIKNTKYFMAPQYYDSIDTPNALPEPRGLFSWIGILFRITEDDVFRMRGLDAALYIRFQKLMAIVFVSFIPLAIGCLLPVNYTATNNDVTQTIRDIPKLSVGNIPENSGRLYAHAIATAIFTFIIFWFSARFYQKFLSLRTLWMKTDEPHNYTVMYTSTSAITEDPVPFFNEKFPGEIADTQFAIEAESFKKVAKDWGKMAQKLRFSQAALDETGYRPVHKLKPLFGEKVDSIDYYTARVEELTRTLERKRDDFFAANQRTHVGFVTFQSIAQAYEHASEEVAMGPAHFYKASPAPQEFDVMWEDLHKSPAYRRSISPILWTSVGALIVFWSAITVFAQGLVNLENLSQISAFSWLTPVLNWNPIATGFITQLLPSLVVTILTALLPKILMALVRLRGVNSKSRATIAVMKIYFVFLIINVFLVSIFVGGTLNVLYDLIRSGQNPLALLGSGVPSQATFFLSFTITYTFIKVPLQILRIGPFFGAMIKKYRAKSAFEEHEAQAQKPLNWQILYGVDLLFFVIGVTYATIQPFILPWIVLYFFFEFLVSKYLIIYSQKPEFDSGGLAWPPLFRRLLGGLALAQLIILGLLILKKSPALAIVAPLPILTLLFGIYMHRKYDNLCLYLNEQERDKVRGTTGGGNKFVGVYRDPMFHHNFVYDKQGNWKLPTDNTSRKYDIEHAYARYDNNNNNNNIRRSAGYGSV